MKQYDYLIIGAGLFGSVFAQQMKTNGKRCLVIDKRTHTGGNIYCRKMEGIDVHLYGAHIFHTANETVWQYVNRFVSFNHFINSPLAFYKEKLYNLPFNMNTFQALWGVRTPAEAKSKLREQQEAYSHIQNPNNLEEKALTICGEDIYYAFIKEYTEKQWGRPAKELPAFIINRIPFRFTYDNNYFNDPYQGIPVLGYNHLIDTLLEGVEVKTGTDYFCDRDYWDKLGKKIIFTGCIDAYFSHEFGKLEYRSLHFEHNYLGSDDYQGNAVVNYNEKKYPFTRIIEHKHFVFGKQTGTIISKEYPQNFEKGDEPFYPVNDEFNMALLKKYTQRAASLPNVIFGGRLGQYTYFDMDDTIDSALKLAEKELCL